MRKNKTDISGGSGANRQFLELLRPLWIPVAGTILALFLLTAVNMATPILVGTVFSRVFPERNWPLLWMILGGLAVLFLIRNFLFYQSKCTAMKVGEEVCFTLRTRLFERLQQKSLAYTRTQSPGKLSSKVMNDSLKIQEFIQGDLPKFIQAALLFTGLFIMIYVLNWQLALASTFVLPLHVLTYRYFGGRIKMASRRSREHIDFAAGNIVESLAGVEVVKGFLGEERESRAFQEAISSSRRSQLETLRFVALQKVCADMLVGIGMLALIGFGAYQVIGKPGDAAMTSGDFIAFFWYIKLLYPTVIDLMSSGGKLAGVHVSIERAFELLDDQPASGKPARARPPLHGNIEFDNVSFSFESRGGDDEPSSLEKTTDTDVLKEVSFSVDSGTVCAITGPSGAGKTTMVSMLPLLLRPERGSIRIDGHDIRTLDLSHLRRSIGVVFQECFLFNTTIMENLRYARPDAPPHQIIEVCAQTGADQFISQLPQSYNSIVGENGITLSRGQKQMITLTRAVIKNPEILILDEATASLDPSLESYVIPTILELMKGRTTLMITHNPKLLEHADCELTLKNGRVAAFKDFRKAKPGAPHKSAASSALSALILTGLLALGSLLPPAAYGAGMTTHRVRLSHVAPDRCMQMLQLYGIAVGQAGKPVNAKTLPTVVNLPSTAGHDILPKMGAGFKPTDSDPIGDLLVFYDPAKPEQLSRVLDLIRSDIDRPARQIMLEAMVMEISEVSLNRLGVEWALGNRGDNPTVATLGNLTADAGGINDQLSIGVVDVFNRFDVELRALIREGEAEIISRPSVLTLDNRMAYIDVSDLIPIPKSRYHGNQAIQTVDFTDRKVGIELSIRPRINEDGEEISLQVNALVSAVVPGDDVEVKQGNDVIASSPVISVREVKTYARIANNTPFIIGGLIAKDDTGTRDRVPLLGSIPLLGRFFRSESLSQMKREVIIVITPFVLPEAKDSRSGQEMIGRNLPQDEDMFDSIGNRLFRDAYRIREEDVYDLDFLTGNEELKRLQALADEAAAENVTLASDYPYKRFVNGRIPGEEILVYRQIYSVIRRIGLDQQVNEDQLIFFKKTPEQSTGFDVVFLTDFLEDEADRIWAEQHPGTKRPGDVWEALGDRAVALTYTNRRTESDAGQIMFEQVPEIRLVDCAGRDEFDRLLWELNRPDEKGRERGTILLHTERDLRRVKQAIVLREAIDLNGTGDTMTLANFSTGRQLLLPGRNEDKIDLIGGKIARLFITTDRYYDLLREELTKDMDAMRRELEIDEKPQPAPEPKPAPEAKPAPEKKVEPAATQ
jgi:ABC-type multidrug transport system fused ATPase/permease subunit/Flp pilus assembly secretin CpaC